ncbi:DUF2889 domain-containing protein [Natranaerofaba carboxydovora]|uniref:DUF2889 domain-containing protein n=1 Tax=Natranaerofaba carboxydovora TaxID=2742683 RepID=UPI001F13F103|nr:DUF2889 domain-containing protein [Natranaerofaba carboxydovora]UMZ74346.1 hypothetical protein ACONDI_01934 [Natranaerofaba carboxydovora]
MTSLFNRNFNVDIKEKDSSTYQLDVTMKDMYHDFLLTLDVETSEFIIENVQLKLNKKPKEECEELKTLVKKMEGVRVSQGFTKSVTSTLGGSKGCPNLVNLFLISAPLALNVNATVDKKNENLTKEELEILLSDVLGGACLAYPVKE